MNLNELQKNTEDVLVELAQTRPGTAIVLGKVIGYLIYELRVWIASFWILLAFSLICLMLVGTAKADSPKPLKLRYDLKRPTAFERVLNKSQPQKASSRYTRTTLYKEGFKPPVLIKEYVHEKFR